MTFIASCRAMINYCLEDSKLLSFHEQSVNGNFYFLRFTMAITKFGKPETFVFAERKMEMGIWCIVRWNVLWIKFLWISIWGVLMQRRWFCFCITQIAGFLQCCRIRTDNKVHTMLSHESEPPQQSHIIPQLYLHKTVNSNNYSLGGLSLSQFLCYVYDVKV